MAIQALVLKKDNGRNYWKMFILSEAKRIVNQEASRRWRGHHYPPHVPAHAVKAKFVNMKASEKRHQQIRTRMDFLFQLIRHRLSVGRPETEVGGAEVCASEEAEVQSDEAKEDDAEPLGGSEGSDQGSKEDSVFAPAHGDLLDGDISDQSSASGEGGAYKRDSSSEDGSDSGDKLDYTTLSIDNSNLKESLESDQAGQAQQMDHPDSGNEDEDDWADLMEEATYVKRGHWMDQIKLRFHNQPFCEWSSVGEWGCVPCGWC
ncbi:uncharacterized protein MELLADRAFT_87398 [Melampsora larici-populina 98AG31]|uniref:Uncharacterized protein n=1 Tax=Melampsora larici-populina (strain 98AG31 / pathotype 3-4-7) TaxID=747676 RepID=F4RN62_MELLP|nr:uncharacterized protein MELLADRAFT_87398 [Melampsora larici-populina 98AG31]EGG06273.1 hypothetical protein MELLADRAFT_87398 [Melampsora larici-populina 98AG31]